MNTNHNTKLARLAADINEHLQTICMKIPNRHPGSKGNADAAEYFSRITSQAGLQVRSDWFGCMDWECGSVILEAGQEKFEAFAGPYSLPYSGVCELTEVSTLDELKAKQLTGRIILIHGELAKEQFVPKNYPFYSVDEHKEIIAILEEARPAAIIAATGKNPYSTAALSPFPLIEDGAFDIPSVYMTVEEGRRLRSYAGMNVTLKFESARIPARACNVIARKNTGTEKKIVICAHIDAKKTTPGALDNAAGISVLLGLARLLENYSGNYQVELLAINGEDYYAGSGEVDYLQRYSSDMKNTELAINIDAAGYKDGDTHYSFYECSEKSSSRLSEIFSSYEGISEGESWPMSDHMVFAMNGVPAVAITSEKFMHVCSTINHTEKDVPEEVDAGKLAALSCAIMDLLEKY